MPSGRSRSPCTQNTEAPCRRQSSCYTPVTTGVLVHPEVRSNLLLEHSLRNKLLFHSLIRISFFTFLALNINNKLSQTSSHNQVRYTKNPLLNQELRQGAGAPDATGGLRFLTREPLPGLRQELRHKSPAGGSSVLKLTESHPFLYLCCAGYRKASTALTN